jgi:hypothetical protein
MHKQFGKVLNLIAEQAGVKDWNSPIDSIILGNYFKVFDAASALYGHTVAKQVEQNGKATTVYIGTLPAPRAGKTCADAIDLFEKTIYVKVRGTHHTLTHERDRRDTGGGQLAENVFSVIVLNCVFVFCALVRFFCFVRPDGVAKHVCVWVQGHH